MNLAAPDLIVSAARVVTPTGVVEGGQVRVREGRILSVGPAAAGPTPPSARHPEFEDATLLPGFIDLHVHGGGGWRVGVEGRAAVLGEPEEDPLVGLSAFLATTGVTGFLPTLSTSTHEVMVRTVSRVAALVGRDLKGADILGSHLEGPYLNPVRKGAQREDLMRLPSREDFLPVWEASRRTVRYVTLAPELPGALEFASWLRGLGVFVSAGHSDAGALEMERAYSAGVRGVTHLFNGMRGMHHREPGVVGWALSKREAWAELIGDGLHVLPMVTGLAIKAKGADRITIITDAGAYMGLPDGEYDEGERILKVQDGRCLLPDGTIAESTSSMAKNCLVLRHQVGMEWPDIARMTSLNPATVLGRQDRTGSLEVGKDADMMVLSSEGEALLTTVRGRIVHLHAAIGAA